MSSHRRPDTRRLPAACPRCLRNLRLTHTLTVSRHSSTERPASSASALSAATVSGLHSLPLTRHASHSSTERPASFASAATASGLLHSSQAHQLHGEHDQKASTREIRLLHMGQCLWTPMSFSLLLVHRRASTCPRSHTTAIPDGARPELQAASGWRAPVDSYVLHWCAPSSSTTSSSRYGTGGGAGVGSGGGDGCRCTAGVVALAAAFFAAAATRRAF